MDEFNQKKKENVQQTEEKETSSSDVTQNIEPQTVSESSSEHETPASNAAASVMPPQTAEPSQQQGYYPPYPPYSAGVSSPYSGTYPGYPQQPNYPQNPLGYGCSGQPYHPSQQYYPPQPQGWGPAPIPPAHGKKWSASKITCVVVAAVLELILVGFSVFGIYALCTGNYGYRQTSSFYQNGYDQRPGINNGGNNGTEDENNNTSARMGLTCAMLTEEQAASININSGMVIMAIDNDSDAKNQNIAIGDVITHINGTEMTSFDDYYKLMEGKPPGDTFDLTVVKLKDTKNDQGVWDTETVQVTLTLQEKTTTESKYPET